MPECLNIKFEALLHAYELGMLNENERREMELHLMDCESCLARIEKLRHAARLMRENSVVRGTVNEMDKGSPDPGSDAVEAKAPVGRWKKLMPAFLMTAAILIVLVFKPWNLEFSPDKEAIAAENRLLIMPFTNLVNPDDPDRLGLIVSNLLVTDLAESEYMQVVSSQRVDDLLRLERETGNTDNISATEIARKAQARYLLVGSIVQVEPYYILSTQMIAVGTSDVIASQKITGSPGDNIFYAIDKLSQRVKNDLPLPRAAFKEVDLDISEVTTDSYQAYFHFTEAKQHLYQHRWSEAVRSFQKALDYDSTFAMAHYYLTLMLGNVNHLNFALKYSKNITRLEKYYIESLDASFNQGPEKYVEILEKIVRFYPDEKDAHLQLGLYYRSVANYDKAIQFFDKVIEFDPDNKIVYNYISLSYSEQGNFEKAMEANSRYIEAAPDEPNPYDSRGQILANFGHLDEAIEAYQKAISIDSNFVHALTKQALLYVFKGDLHKADSCQKLSMIRSDNLFRSTVRLHQSYLPLHQGRLSRTLKILNDALEQDSLELIPDTEYHMYFLKFLAKAMIFAEMRNFNEASESYNSFNNLGPYSFAGLSALSNNCYIEILIQSGQIEKAEQEADSLRALLEKSGMSSHPYDIARSQIEMSRGNYKDAVNLLKDYSPLPYDFYYHYWRGQAYFGDKNYEAAIGDFEAVVNSYTSLHLFFGIIYVKTYYYLGLAYEAQDDINGAIAAFEQFLDLYADADFEFEEIRDARNRLARLKNHS